MRLPLLLVIGLLLAIGSPAGGGAARGDQLAFVALDGDAPQVFLISADGAGRRRLTGPPGFSTSPVWSPDGSTLAIVHHRQSLSQIVLIDVARGRGRSLTSLKDRSAAPFWSPDGRWIVFLSSARGGPQVAVMRQEGGAPRLLTAPPGERRAPKWSPDGRWIAFRSMEDHPYFELFVMAADGRLQRRVPTRSPGIEEEVTDFAWLPDGRIAYANRSGPAQQVTTITTLDGARHEFLGTASSSVWTRDGRNLAFVVSRVGSAQIYVRLRQGQAVPLTDRSVISVRPSWSPDGRRLAYLAVEHGEVRLVTSDPDGTHRRVVTTVYGDLSTLPVYSWRPR